MVSCGYCTSSSGVKWDVMLCGTMVTDLSKHASSQRLHRIIGW